jgi:integration host factor subunit beta
MLKSQLVDRLAEQNRHLYRRDLEKVVDAILDQIAAALARGDRVELRGFGAFSVKSRTARDGRNPRARALLSRSARNHFRTSRPTKKCTSASMGHTDHESDSIMTIAA